MSALRIKNTSESDPRSYEPRKFFWALFVTAKFLHNCEDLFHLCVYASVGKIAV